MLALFSVSKPTVWHGEDQDGALLLKETVTPQVYSALDTVGMSTFRVDGPQDEAAAAAAWFLTRNLPTYQSLHIIRIDDDEPGRADLDVEDDKDGATGVAVIDETHVNIRGDRVRFEALFQAVFTAYQLGGDRHRRITAGQMRVQLEHLESLRVEDKAITRDARNRLLKALGRSGPPRL